VTAPLPRPRSPGYAQLGLWVRKPVKTDLARAAAAEGRAQREIVEEALADYFRKRANLPASYVHALAKPAAP
jgi:hypothetical protein